ncbi:hypothetical protein [Flavobacterium pectinovorum]|uniref:Chain length determinant protein n=1 Tax=Flavobacterium pectinovorum TaxID=29533 RepID=A0A502E969_9FLAO|nr:hypothetical protein [Flavobacterium pectinovorum]TPG33947.1 hypothetical protein EAH81_23660 [Flavobacterium pectinovorum]
MIQAAKEDNESLSILKNSLFLILKWEFKIILSVTSLFTIIGLFYVLNIQKEYISTGKIMPEVSYKAPNGMAGVYQLLKKYNNNIDLYNTEITSSDLYAEIIKTNDFCKYILSKNVKTSTNKIISLKSYYDYYLQNNTSLVEKRKSNSTITDGIKYNSNIQKRIVVTTSKKSNVILVTAQMPDPSVAADVANLTMAYLMDYITHYRTEKARNELQFIENLQKNISKDATKNDISANEIQNNLVALTVQMQIQIQEDTPVFQILEKAEIPLSSSEPSIFNILITFSFIGFLIGVVIAYLKNNNYKILFDSTIKS